MAGIGGGSAGPPNAMAAANADSSSRATRDRVIRNLRMAWGAPGCRWRQCRPRSDAAGSRRDETTAAATKGTRRGANRSPRQGRLHALEQVRVEPADGQRLAAALQRQEDLAGLVAPRAGDAACLHHRAAVHLPEGFAGPVAAAARAATCGSVLALGGEHAQVLVGGFEVDDLGHRHQVHRGTDLRLDHLQPRRAAGCRRRAEQRAQLLDAGLQFPRRALAVASVRCSRAMHAASRAPSTGLSR